MNNLERDNLKPAQSAISSSLEGPLPPVTAFVLPNEVPQELIPLSPEVKTLFAETIQEGQKKQEQRKAVEKAMQQEPQKPPEPKAEKSKGLTPQKAEQIAAALIIPLAPTVADVLRAAKNQPPAIVQKYEGSYDIKKPLTRIEVPATATPRPEEYKKGPDRWPPQKVDIHKQLADAIGGIAGKIDKTTYPEMVTAVRANVTQLPPVEPPKKPEQQGESLDYYIEHAIAPISLVKIDGVALPKDFPDPAFQKALDENPLYGYFKTKYQQAEDFLVQKKGVDPKDLQIEAVVFPKTEADSRPQVMLALRNTKDRSLHVLLTSKDNATIITEFIPIPGNNGTPDRQLYIGMIMIDGVIHPLLITAQDGKTPDGFMSWDASGKAIFVPLPKGSDVPTPQPIKDMQMAQDMLAKRGEPMNLESASIQLKTEKNQPTSIVINGKEIPVTMLDPNVIIENYTFNPRAVKPKWGITDKHIEAPAGGSRKDYKLYAITGIVVGTDEVEISAKNPKDGSMVPLKLDRVYLLIPVQGGFVKARISRLNFEGVPRAEKIRGPNLNRFGISHDGYGWKVYSWSDIKTMLVPGGQTIPDIYNPPQGNLEKSIQEKLNNGVGYEDLVAQLRAYNALYPDGFKKLQTLRPDPKGGWIDVPGLAQITVPIRMDNTVGQSSTAKSLPNASDAREVFFPVPRSRSQAPRKLGI